MNAATKTGADVQQAVPFFGVKVGVGDALAIYRDVTSRGIPAKEPFVGNNLWVVSMCDPDGYRIAFESPTDVPAETKLSEWKSDA